VIELKVEMCRKERRREMRISRAEIVWLVATKNGKLLIVNQFLLLLLRE
jgi:hypothetical protein